MISSTINSVLKIIYSNIALKHNMQKDNRTFILSYFIFNNIIIIDNKPMKKVDLNAKVTKIRKLNTNSTTTKKYFFKVAK